MNNALSAIKDDAKGVRQTGSPWLTNIEADSRNIIPHVSETTVPQYTKF
jgi:hypothetical protein